MTKIIIHFSWRDMLPVILMILEQEKYINHRGTEVSGPEYKSLIIKSICSQPWDNSILTALATMFTTIKMDAADHDTAIRALCHKIADVEHSELPPLVHQILLLSNNKDSKLVIGTLQTYFTNLYNQAPDESPDAITMDGIGHVSRKEIQDTESTVLYHIHQSASNNHSSMKDFIRNLKSITGAPEFVLHPFLMAVLLLISENYGDDVFDVIKQAIIRKIADDTKRNNSAWLSTILPANWGIMDIMHQIIENSNKDRHLVITGLVDLAFVLLDTKSSHDDHTLHKIGCQIVQKLVKKRYEIGKVVLERVSNKIIESGTCLSQYSDCLAYMCRKSALVVLDSQIWISELLQNLLVLPGEAATQVLHATLPLMRSSTNIRDSLVLILHKVLYRPGIENRKMGVTGFLQFLTNLKIPAFSMSQCNSSNASQSSSIFTQATVERRQAPSARNNAAFCQEMLGILKRCFTHEVEVRAHLYKGLHNAVTSNPELSEHVIDMLLTHLNSYYEADEDVKPPLNFHSCCNIDGPEAILQEPIGNLVFALQKIYCEMAMKDLNSIDQLSNVLESLCRRMAATELEHLNVDDGTDLLDNMPKAQQKVLSLKLNVTTLEALIAYRINAWSIDSLNTGASVNSLFKHYQEIVELSKRVSKPKKGEAKKRKKDQNDTTINKKNRGKAFKLPITIMDIQTVKKMMALLYAGNINWATEEQTAILKKKTEFHFYVLNTCVQLFAQAKQIKNFEKQLYKDKNKKDYLEIGTLLYVEVISCLDLWRDFDEDLAIACCECFREYIDLMSNNFSSELPVLLSKICGIDATEGLGVQIKALITALQYLITAFYEKDTEEDSPTHKIPLLLLETILLLIQNTANSRVKFDELFLWLQTLAKTEKQTPIAMIILQLIAIIEERQAEHGRFLDELALELCDKFGTIDETDVSVNDAHKIFNDDTQTTAYTVFNNAVKNKINNVMWALGRLKSEQFVSSTLGMADERHREELKVKERSLCRHLSYAIKTLESLANTSVPPGPITKITFENLQQIYFVASQLTKYFSSKSTPENPAFQDVKFIQVIQLAGKSLKTAFYNLIHYTEDNLSSGGKADAHALKNKVVKDTKFIPKVVYEMEQFQKDILALGNKTGIPLDSYLKHSIARDFRIKRGELVEGLERLDNNTQATTQNTAVPGNASDDENDEVHEPLDDDENIDKQPVEEDESENIEDSDSEARPTKRQKKIPENDDNDDDD